MKKNALAEDAFRTIIHICHEAWGEKLMDGWSGNASLRIGEDCIAITAAGTQKGRLDQKDCLLVDANGNILAGDKKPSSEMPLHLGIYATQAACGAILHTHPVNMQALGLALPDEAMEENFLNIPLYESEMWRKNLFFAPGLAPGSNDLAQAAANSLPQNVSLPVGIWLKAHGLCALAATLGEALSLTEEMEHLAATQLRAMAFK